MRAFWMLCLTACTSGLPTDTDAGTESETGSGTETETETETAVRDIDEDGYDTTVDCDDYNPDVHPGATETWNGEDDDCDGREDGDGHYEGSASVAFRVVYEGKRYNWNLTCASSVDRAGWQVDVQTRCEPPPDDSLARQVMGEWFTISEKDNIATDGRWSGSTEVESSDGWTVKGSGYLAWQGFDEATGEMAMRSTFAELDATVRVSYKP